MDATKTQVKYGEVALLTDSKSLSVDQKRTGIARPFFMPRGLLCTTLSDSPNLSDSRHFANTRLSAFATDMTACDSVQGHN
jgi:hypothetical protein